MKKINPRELKRFEIKTQEDALMILGSLIAPVKMDLEKYAEYRDELEQLVIKYAVLNEDKETYTMLYFEQIERRNRPLTVDALNIEPGTNVQEFFYYKCLVFSKKFFQKGRCYLFENNTEAVENYKLF